MAFWNNSETEELKEEIHQQIRNYILEKQKLALEKDSLILQLEKSKTECAGFEKALYDSLNRHIACEDRVMDCQREVRRLQSEIELLEARKVHNERGAGRKSRITQEDIFLTKQCMMEGKSLAEIADVLSEKSGRSWSRSSVKYLIDKHCRERLEELSD